MYYKMKSQSITYHQEKLVQELRRGVLVMAVLSQLNEAQYGYSLINELSDKGLEIDQGTLYPLLRRLESEGLLMSEWNTEGSRPRRYYVISQLGKEVLKALRAEWEALSGKLNQLIYQDPNLREA